MSAAFVHRGEVRNPVCWVTVDNGKMGKHKHKDIKVINIEYFYKVVLLQGWFTQYFDYANKQYKIQTPDVKCKHPQKSEHLWLCLHMNQLPIR